MGVCVLSHHLYHHRYVFLMAGAWLLRTGMGVCVLSHHLYLDRYVFLMAGT